MANSAAASGTIRHHYWVRSALLRPALRLSCSRGVKGSRLSTAKSTDGIFAAHNHRSRSVNGSAISRSSVALCRPKHIIGPRHPRRTVKSQWLLLSSVPGTMSSGSPRFVVACQNFVNEYPSCSCARSRARSIRGSPRAAKSQTTHVLMIPRFRQLDETL
jgi:hypothetical protein